MIFDALSFCFVETFCKPTAASSFNTTRFCTMRRAIRTIFPLTYFYSAINASAHSLFAHRTAVFSSQDSKRHL